jgi:hypothetical protein
MFDTQEKVAHLLFAAWACCSFSRTEAGQRRQALHEPHARSFRRPKHTDGLVEELRRHAMRFRVIAANRNSLGRHVARAKCPFRLTRHSERALHKVG